MALFVLPFGHGEWPSEPPAGSDVPALRAAHGELPLDRLTLTVPSTLKDRIEASAALEGLSPDAWIRRSLARSVDPRLAAH